MKRQKAYFIDLIKQGVIYFNYCDFKDKKNAVTGTRYTLEKPLTSEQKNYFKKFKNVYFGTCFYRYAPEQKFDTIILPDKVLKEQFPYEV